MQTWLANHWISLAVGLAVGVVVALISFARPAPPAMEIRPREPQPTPTAMIYVHVDGAVLLPGVYSLPSGARIFEAIDAAGGAAEDAEVRQLNLAARVADGQKLVVPWRSAAAPQAERAREEPAVVAPSARAAPAAAGALEGSARININTASQRMLESLPGIGPVTAGRIIDYRQANGPFSRIEQLREARLVNAPTYERISGLISVE